MAQLNRNEFIKAVQEALKQLQNDMPSIKGRSKKALEMQSVVLVLLANVVTKYTGEHDPLFYFSALRGDIDELINFVPKDESVNG